MEAEALKQNISLKDERLDVDQIDHYHLSFFIGINSCEILVFDDRKKRVVLFESFSLNSDHSLLENLKALHHNHALVSAGFWKTVSIILRDKSFAQVPNDVYSADYIYDYLKLNTHTDPLNEKYLSILDERLGCTTVFSVAQDLIRWIDGKYPKPRIIFKHQSITLLEAVLPLTEKSQDQLFVNLTDNEMIVAGFTKGKLAIYNQFNLQTPQQAAKMMLLSIKQFTNSGQATPITLWGVRNRVNSYEPVFRKFFKNLKKGTRPKGIKMSYVFDELKDYEYFDVLASHEV